MKLKVLLLGIVLLPVVLQAGESVSENDLKLALAYKIAKFVTWPDEASSSEFQFCVADEDTLRVARKRLAERAVRRRKIRVVNIDLKAPLTVRCDTLYISSAAADSMGKLLESVSQLPVLTLSDQADFAHIGGMVALVTRNKRVVMEINIANYERVGLTVNSQLLQMAELIDAGQKAQR